MYEINIPEQKYMVCLNTSKCSAHGYTFVYMLCLLLIPHSQNKMLVMFMLTHIIKNANALKSTQHTS